MENAGLKDNTEVQYKKEGMTTKEASKISPKPVKLISKHGQYNTTGVAWHCMPEVVADKSISNAFGNLDIVRCLSTKGVPKIANELAYTTSSRKINTKYHVSQCLAYFQVAKQS